MRQIQGHNTFNQTPSLEMLQLDFLFFFTSLATAPVYLDMCVSIQIAVWQAGV